MFNSVTACLLTPLSIGLLEYFDSLTKISEEGLCAEVLQVNFQDVWPELFVNFTAKLEQQELDADVAFDDAADVFKIEGSTWRQTVEEVCADAKELFRKVQRPKMKQEHLSDDCTASSIDEAHFISRHTITRLLQTLNRERRLPAAAFKFRHPLADAILQVGLEPFSVPLENPMALANLKSSWIGLRVAPLVSVDPLAKTTKRQFQLTDVFVLDSTVQMTADAVTFQPPLVVINIAPARADPRDLLTLLFLFDWDNPSEYAIASLGLTIARYLATTQWNSRDVVIAFADSKAPYAAGEVFLFLALAISSHCFDSINCLGARVLLNDYFRNPLSRIPKRGIMRSAIVIQPGHFSASLDLFIDTGTCLDIQITFTPQYAQCFRRLRRPSTESGFAQFILRASIPLCYECCCSHGIGCYVLSLSYFQHYNFNGGLMWLSFSLGRPSNVLQKTAASILGIVLSYSGSHKALFLLTASDIITKIHCMSCL